MGGITDRLLQAMEQAAQTDEAYKEVLVELEERHLEVIRGNIPANKQSGLISFVKVQLNHLETILEVFICCKKSPRQQIKLPVLGTFEPSNRSYFIEHKLDVQRIDGRELIETSVQNNRQIINWAKTAKMYIVYMANTKLRSL